MLNFFFSLFYICDLLNFVISYGISFYTKLEIQVTSAACNCLQFFCCSTTKFGTLLLIKMYLICYVCLCFCSAPTEPCIDRKGNTVGEGESYKPRGYDTCMQCKCQNGERSMCVQTQCAQPRCKNYMPDPDVCCTYHCLDDDGNTTPNGSK